VYECMSRMYWQMVGVREEDVKQSCVGDGRQGCGS